MKIRKRRTLRVVNPQKLEFIGHQYLENPEMQLFAYNNEAYSEDTEFTIEKLRQGKHAGMVTWLNVHGIHEVDLVDRICTGIGMPRFIEQDILDTNQRTKLQDLGDYIFFSIKSILPSSNLDLDIEQISFIVGHDSLYSFQERKGDHFEHVRTRIRNNNGLVRQKGPDFLLFLLIEGIIENYYTTVEMLEEEIRAEADPLKSRGADPSIINSIESYKRKLLKIRRNIAALRDALNSIEKETSSVIKSEQLKYFFDLKDNCLFLLESIDAMELRLDSAENLFFSMQGHRMNQVMTTLTIMAAIFIPLTFMAGVYGMNFKNMPELEWEWGYFVLLGIMAVVAGVLVYYFRRRKWL